MPELLINLQELADPSEIQAFFNRRGYRFEDNEVVDCDGVPLDETEVIELCRDFELIYE